MSFFPRRSFIQILKGFGLFIFCLLPWAQILAVMLNMPVMITEDSGEYLNFAHGIIQSNFSLIQGTAIYRAPGYPILLAFGNIIFGDVAERLIYLHLLWASSMTLVAIWSLSCVIPVWITLGAVGWYALFNAPFSLAMLTEWSVGFIIVATLSLAVRFLWKPNLRIFGVITFLIAFAILCRPPMIVLSVIPVIGLVCLGRNRLKLAVIILLCSAALPLSWAFYNYSTHGVLSLSPRSGIVKLAQAGLFSDSDISCGEICQSDDEVKFVHSFSELKKTPEDLGQLERRVEKAYNSNYGLILGLVKENGWSPQQADDFSSQLRDNILRGRWRVYLNFIFSEFISQIYILSPEYQVGFLILFSLLIVRVSKQGIELKHPLILTSTLAIGIHLIHMALCVGAVHMLPRFFLLTFLPVVYMLILCLGFSYTKKGSLSAAL